MFVVLNALALLIAGMFVASVLAALVEARRDARAAVRRPLL